MCPHTKAGALSWYSYNSCPLNTIWFNMGIKQLSFQWISRESLNFVDEYWMSCTVLLLLYFIRHWDICRWKGKIQIFKEVPSQKPILVLFLLVILFVSLCCFCSVLRQAYFCVTLYFSALLGGNIECCKGKTKSFFFFFSLYYFCFSVCVQGWSEIMEHTCVCLPDVRIKVVCHHTVMSIFSDNAFKREVKLTCLNVSLNI